MVQTSLKEMEDALAKGDYRRFPVCREILSDIATPVQVLRRLMEADGHCFLLESAEDNQQWGRYTFLGYDPTMELVCKDHVLTVTTDEKRTMPIDDLGGYIRRVIEENRAPKLPGLPPLSGGLVGYFSYDFLKYSEPSLRLDAEDIENFNDVDLMLFDKMIAFDNYRQKIILICNVALGDAAGGSQEGVQDAACGKSLSDLYRQALGRLDEMEALVCFGKEKQATQGRLRSGFRPLFEKEAFCEKVEEVKRHIREGDIFQLVLSNRLEAKMEGSLLDAYRVLRTTNPSPYMFYFSGADGEIAGASPETLVKLEGEKLYTFPLAGTRPRGLTEEEDKRLEKELLADEKELAEHNMLVDLGRNDIGRISRVGSVKVEKYMSIERYSHVMHIGSTVSGTLREDKDALDAVDAILPAGTLSGAPKLRACEIINRLENNKRGIYGGAIGYLSFTGNLDTCIAIRLAFSKNGKVFIRSGAGIVADSVPENEYRECLQKAAAVKNAIELEE